MKILVHKRIGEGDFYVKLAKLAFPQAEIVSLSDEAGKATYWTGEFRKRFKKVTHSVDEFESIMCRCRYLRKLHYSKAEDLVRSVDAGISRMLKIEKPDLVLGGLIDCYIQDLLERNAAIKGIKYVSFVGHFFNGYFRISVRGELHRMRDTIQEEEVKHVLSTLADLQYKPKFKLNKKKSKGEILKLCCREYFKKWVYFPAKSIISWDFQNYHYNTFSFEGKFAELLFENNKKYFTPIASLKPKPNDITIYLPLHFSPEATVDYWVDDFLMADYEKSILELLKTKDQNVFLIIKEHPGMESRRRHSFYEKLLEFSNVALISPHDNSNVVLNSVDRVLVYTGSVGVEALLKGKLVFTVTKNYYSDLHPNVFHIKDLTSLSLSKTPTEYPNEFFIESILKGLWKGLFINDKELNKSDIDSMADALRAYLGARTG